MEDRRTPGREVIATVWAAALTPSVRLLPGVGARLGGAAGWLAPLIALPAALLLTVLPDHLVQEGEDGLAPAMARLLGRRRAQIAYIIYMIWAVVLTAARLRMSEHFFLAAVGQEGSRSLVLLPMAAMTAYLAAKPGGAVARTGGMIARVLAAALAGWIVLSLFRVRVDRLWPFRGSELAGAARTGALTAGIWGCGIYGAFFGWRRSERRLARVTGWAAAVTAAQACVIGALGPALAGQTADPFLMLSRSVGVEGAVQRVESLAAALGLLGDLTLGAMLLGAGRRLLNEIRPAWGARRSAGILAGCAALLAASLFARWESACAFALTAAPVGSGLLGLGVPILLFALSRREKSGLEKNTSCAKIMGKSADVVADLKGKKSLKNHEKNC